MKKRYIIIIILVTLLGITGWYFRSDISSIIEIIKFANMDESSIEKLLTEDTGDIELIIPSNDVVPDATVEPENNEPKQPEEQPEQQPEQESGEKNTTNKPNKPIVSIEDQIVSKYKAQFLSLQNESMAQLKALGLKAAGEYKNLPKDKKSSEAISLALGYINQGKALEAECDKKFNNILANMKEELKKNNLSMNAADEAEKEYKQKKSVQKSVLMKEALSQIKK